VNGCIAQVREVRGVLRTGEARWGGGGAVVKASGAGHRGEIDEALAAAAHRWSRLFDLEAQIQREEANLALQAKGRTPDPGAEVIQRLNADYDKETANLRQQLAVLKEEAKRTRKELERLTIPSILTGK
jgi:hypothetical protein